VLLRRLGLPRALCGHRRQRPAHHPGDIAAAAILLDRGWGAADQFRAELAAPPLLSISAFSAKFGLGIIWLSEVRVGDLFRVATPLVPAERPGFFVA